MAGLKWIAILSSRDCFLQSAFDQMDLLIQFFLVNVFVLCNFKRILMSYL